MSAIARTLESRVAGGGVEHACRSARDRPRGVPSDGQAEVDQIELAGPPQCDVSEAAVEGLGRGRHVERLRAAARAAAARQQRRLERGDRALEPRSLYTRYQPLNKRCCGNPSLQQKMKRGIITQ